VVRLTEKREGPEHPYRVVDRGAMRTSENPQKAKFAPAWRSAQPRPEVGPGPSAREAHIVGYYVLVYADTTDRAGEGLGHRGGAE
jgi:hypothetical protein